MMADFFVPGFDVSTIWWALLFSLLLSILQSIFHSVLDKKKK
jgi:putative membrane protein